MKAVLLVMGGLLFTFYATGQRRQEEFIMWPTDANSEKILFSESVYMPSNDANSLYGNARKFARNTFKGERDTIIENDSNKTLTCRSAFFTDVEELGDRGKGYIMFTLNIRCHNNSYRYFLTDFEHFPLNPDCVVGGALENEKATSGAVSFPRKYWNAQKAKCYYRIQTTIEQLKQAMSAEAES